MRRSPVPFLLRLPAKLKTMLTDLARKEHRSLNQEIVYLLEAALCGQKEATSAEAPLEKRPLA
jgi:hypothetical protein